MQLNNPIFINQSDADNRYINTTGDSINGVLSVTGLTVSGLGNSFILKSPSNFNSVYFDPTSQGGAGILQTNYLTTISLLSVGDFDLGLSYGGGGSRSLKFNGYNGSVSATRAMIDSNGNFGIASGISSVPSRFYVSGNARIDGDITRSGDSIFPLMGPAFPRGTNKRVHIPAGTTYMVLGGAPITTTANSGIMSLNPYYLTTDMTGSDIILTTTFYTTPFGSPTLSGALGIGIYDASSGLENATLMESFVIAKSVLYSQATSFVNQQPLSKFYKKGWYVTVATRFASGSYTGALHYNAAAPQNLQIFGTPTGTSNYSTTTIPNGYNQTAVLSITGVGYPLPDSFSSIPSSWYQISSTNIAPPVYLIY
jgi:hypothetical protein